MNGCVGRGSYSRTFRGRIGDVFEKGKVKSVFLMNVNEAKEICNDRSKWNKVVSA